LDKEIPKLKDEIKSVQLCFTTDPFMYGYKEIEDMSIAAIKKINASGIKVFRSDKRNPAKDPCRSIKKK
jgi:hypothetical protein